MVGRPGGLEALGRDALSGGVNNFSTRGRGAAPAFLSRRSYGFTRLFRPVFECASRAVRPMSGVAQCVTCGLLYSDGGTCPCHVPNWDGTPCAGCGCKRVVDAPVAFARWRVIDEHGVTVASFDDRCDAEDAAGALVAGRVLDGRARVPCPVPGCGCPTWCPTCPRCHDV